MLRADDDSLSGLEVGKPLLVAADGRSTGFRIVSRLGRGGMSTVFLAERDPDGSTLLSTAPPRVALKLVQPSTLRQLARLGVDAEGFVRKEAIALYTVAGTRNVIELYGDGHVEVTVETERVVLPWMALELVEGASLEERAAGVVEPRRARNWIRGVAAGISALHHANVIHRDVKPANVLVADTPEGEIAKLSDCGIARLIGVEMATIAAASVRYAAPEQLCSVTGESNPLIGPWTDVHALAALVWFVLGGCDWFDVSRGWERGERAPLSRAPSVHPRLRDDAALLARIDAVLLRAASMRIPNHARAAAPPSMAGIVYDRTVGQFTGDERYESVDAFLAALDPLLDEACSARIGPSPLADTVFSSREGSVAATPDVEVVELPPPRPDEPFTESGVALVQTDGKVLARVGDRLVYFVDDKPSTVTLLKELAPMLPHMRWILGGPSGGFALVSARQIVHFRGGKQALIPLPARGELGNIVAAASRDGELAIITSEVAGSDGPELFRTRDGATWSEPERLDALNGTPRAMASLEDRVVAVGASHGGRFDRLLVAMRNGDRIVHAPSLAESGALDVVAVDPLGEIAGAGAGFVLRLVGGRRVRSATPVADTPRAMCFDTRGNVVLVTAHAVMRVGDRAEVLHRRQASASPYVAIALTSRGLCAVDTAGGRTLFRAPSAMEPTQIG